MPARRAVRKTRLARGVEYGLWLVACVLLGYCGWVWFDARRHQEEGSRELEKQTAVEVTPEKKVRVRPVYGSTVAKIEIPRLGLSTIVFEGTGDDVLLHGAGHLRSSALPGETGNVVFAAHRDTFFRPLRNLREGDSIDVVTGGGTRHYVVSNTEVVNPDATEVLQPTPDATLTLITCFPFYYVGNAPQRFVARAREVSGDLNNTQADKAGRVSPVEAARPRPSEGEPIRSSDAPSRARRAPLPPFKPTPLPSFKPATSAAPATDWVTEPDSHSENPTHPGTSMEDPAPSAVEPAATASNAPKKSWRSRVMGRITGLVRRPKSE